MQVKQQTEGLDITKGNTHKLRKRWNKTFKKRFSR